MREEGEALRKFFTTSTYFRLKLWWGEWRHTFLIILLKAKYRENLREKLC